MRVLSFLSQSDAPAYRALTFPRHAALLAGDLGPSGTTLALGATVRAVPVGLAIAGPLGGDVAVLHSVVVAPHARRRGVATDLVEAIEAALRARGIRRLTGSHRADRHSSEAIARLLARRGFEPVRSVVELVFPVSRLRQAPALAISCRGAAVEESTPARMAPLMELREPSRMDPAAFAGEASDPELTTLLTLDGQAAACVLGRMSRADTAYLTLLYVRPDLRRRRALAALVLRCFLDRLIEREIAYMSCEVDLDNAPSLAFADEGFGRYADHRAIVRVVAKSLEGAR